jgi:4'-phosphopantetheinyl transferase
LHAGAAFISWVPHARSRHAIERDSDNNERMFDASLWSANPGQLALAPDEIHVWRAYLDFEPASLRGFEMTLSPDEKARAERFHFPRDKNAFVATRGILRELLGRYVGRAPTELVFDYGDRGKPSLRGTASQPVQFNVSCSHGLALMAFAVGRSVGIDVELVRPDFAGVEIAERYFAPREIEELKALPTSSLAEGFFLCWARKEAYVKARGEGLQIPLKSFRVSLTPGQPERLESADSARWSLHAITADTNYVGALVVEGKEARIRYWNWNSMDAVIRNQSERGI